MTTNVLVAPPWLWRLMQVGNLGVTVGLIIGLFLVPEPTLRILWYALVPLLPAVFMVNPMLWRNVCPLATLNLFWGQGQSRVPSKEGLRRWNNVGLVLLAVLVPARHFILNTNGAALGVTISVVALLSLLLGTVFKTKAGFCNSICPVLPVEKLYGQSPLLSIANVRCPTCTRCIPKGCLDQAPKRAAALAMGVTNGGRPVPGTTDWLNTGFATFALAFPGAIIGYYVTLDGPLASAPLVYSTIALYGTGSYVIARIAIWGMGTSLREATTLLAALSLGLYYWFLAPSVAATWGLHPVVGNGIRLAAFLLIGVWLWRVPLRPLVRR